MLSIFKSKPILSSEDTEFQVATFRWLLRNFGGKDFYEDTQLVLPTREYFPSKVESADEAAIETFEAVKRYAGMEEWRCKLEAQEEDVDVRVAPALRVQNAPHSPLGTFEAREDNEIVVTYNPATVGNPTQLVATFAHELAHYLTGFGPEDPPGGWDNWEFATDIAATFLGFGVFMANAARNFQQFTEVDAQGWEYSRNGYLFESEHIFALAIFLGLKGIAAEHALPYLKPTLKKLLKKAVKQISKTEIISDLATVKYVPPDHNQQSQAAM
ncbi:hypothetical protein [Marinimicrobium sp. ABcell2]|uniref:hypothetical protein n=1 Tax=Marinimicrobium sp. ABcell2 TaxID=3069751 RepID=UPI0027B492E4|nr:hypothetical protein [Marinimicrobium sp. ABcell2]MDQ2076383.1 hypothetical protein [Marinimicrobium sp. ABcell2]